MEEIREQDESVQEPVTSPEDEQDAGADVEFDPERFKATLSKKNREAESLRKRLKELEPLAEKARELEEGSKSELQRLQEESGSFKERATKAETELLKLNAAFDRAPAGMDPKQIIAIAKRANGDDEESLAADLDELFELLTPQKAPQRKPAERLRGGGNPDDEPDSFDPNAIVSRIPRY